MNTLNITTFYFFSAFISLVTIHAIPNYNTKDNQMDKLEMLTTSKQIFEHTIDDQLLENKTTSKLNISSVPIMTTNISTIPNSTAVSVGIAGKVVTYKTTYYYYGATTTQSGSSGSGLSGGAIAGIIIGIILLCCLLGCCTKESGHWANAKVWVRD
jgi:hypothetical protein